MEENNVIRGYGALFRRDRRIYSYPAGRTGNRQAIPIRGGLPLRSVGYFAAAVALLWLLTRLPLVSVFAGYPLWPVTFIAVPGAIAAGLTKLEPDGRPAISYLVTLVTHVVSPSCRCAGRPIRREGRVAVLDTAVAIGRQPATTLAAGVVVGPAELEFRDPVAVKAGRRGRHHARPDATSDVRWVELGVGEQLEVHP